MAEELKKIISATLPAVVVAGGMAAAQADAPGAASSPAPPEIAATQAATHPALQQQPAELLLPPDGAPINVNGMRF